MHLSLFGSCPIGGIQADGVLGGPCGSGELIQGQPNEA